MKASVHSTCQSSSLEPQLGRISTTRKRLCPQTYHYARSVSPYGTFHHTHTRSIIISPTGRYGIRAFDTAPYYDSSEIVLGTALNALSHEFPRGSYQLITKVGRYGPLPNDFGYSPEALRKSVRRSLQRLHTQYLDFVYLHDIEFIAPCITPRIEGVHTSALDTEARAYGLEPPYEPDTSGADERILEAIATLRALQADGLIRHIGICGTCSTLLHTHTNTKTTRSPTSNAPTHRTTRTSTHRSTTRRRTILRPPNTPKRDLISIRKTFFK